MRYQQIDEERPASFVLIEINTIGQITDGPVGGSLRRRRTNGQEGQMRPSCALVDAAGNDNGNLNSTRAKAAKNEVG
jgi:hypothetical protein